MCIRDRAKGTTEIHATVDGVEEEMRAAKPARFVSVIVQIMILDIVFSLDSVITAVGMAQHLEVMAAAIIIAVGIMLFAAEPLSRFIRDNVSVKMLALSFLILVGMALLADEMCIRDSCSVASIFSRLNSSTDKPCTIS